MILTHYQGRLGNIMLHNVGASILAKKFNYKIDINKTELFNCLNPKFSNGDKIINNIFLTSYDNPDELKFNSNNCGGGDAFFIKNK
jgi:hypothetical protein